MTGVTFNQYQSYNNWAQPQWQNNTMYSGANTWSPYTAFGWGNTSASSSSSSYKTIKELEKEKFKKNEELNNKLTQEAIKQNESAVFKGLTKQDEKIMKEYATKSKEYVENLGTSLAMGAGMGVALPNLRNVTHPFTAAKTTFSKNSETNKMFKDFVKSDLWKKEPAAMQKAYEIMQKAETRAMKHKWRGWIKRGYTTAEFDELKKIMDSALKTGDKDEILKAAAKLKNADSIKQGLFTKPINWIKSKLGMSVKTRSVAAKVRHGKAIANEAASLAQMTSKNIKTTINSAIGGKVGITFAALSLFSEWEYISAAFKEDTSTGFKQLGQSIAKAGSSWGGYALGEVLGKWGGAKLGAVVGSAICPGLGTLIGAAAGVVCGTVCSWGLRKIANWAVGDNVANELIAKNEVEETKAQGTQDAYLQNFVAQVEADKNASSDSIAVANKIKQMYIAAAAAQNPNGAGQQMQTLG